MERYLRYSGSPHEWMEGLPIGCGRLAAMVLSFKNYDKLSLNNEFLYTGQFRDRDAENVAHFLPYVRDYLKRGDYFRGNMLANTVFGGYGGKSGLKNRVDPYQPAGDLYIKFDEESKLSERKLDIMSGVCSAERVLCDALISSKAICDAKNDLILYCAESEKAFSAFVSFDRIEDTRAATNISYGSDNFLFECNFERSSFKVAAKIFTDGEMTNESDKISVKNAKTLKISLDIISEIDKEKELSEPCDKMFSEHSEYFMEKMSAFEFCLTDEENDEYTDVRLEKYRAGEKDTGLEELYVNFGRYLLLSCSLCGKYPATLQGKWNDNINPPWECDFHIDINIQMCYWLAEKCNMGECAASLSCFALKLMENSEKYQIPQKLFGCRGTYIPIQTDAWAIPTPESFGWAVWVCGAAWIAQHLWWHYIYSGDREYLKCEAYKFFKSTALFFEDFLEEDEKGILQIIPSQSPENGFEEGGKGMEVTLCISSSFDVQLVRDLLFYCIESAKILDVDHDKQKIWEDMRERLPKAQVASDGRIVEWDKEGYTETQPGHRHFSPLYGLFPSEQFTPVKNKALYDACIKTLDFRMSHAGGQSGWSRAWCANIYARVKNTEKFYEHYSMLIKEFATNSLLDLHPPKIFQIDGNCGGASAAIEAVATYYDEKVHLLSAVPESWKKGHIKGFKVPGGHTIDFGFENGNLTYFDITIGYGESVTVAKCKGIDNEISVSGKAGEKVSVFIVK